MRRALCFALLVVCSACSGEEPDPSASDPARPLPVRLVAQNLELLPGDALAARIGFDPIDNAAHIIVTPREADARISVCALSSVDAALPGSGSCKRDIASGVREPIRARDMRAIAIKAAGANAVRADIRLEFEEASRAVTIVLPRLRAPASPDCADNACNPFFELVPTAAGAFQARARWTGPDATLVLLQGSVLGRSHTATGIPYGEPARASGASPLAIETTMGAPAEYAVVLRHQNLRPGAPALEDVVLEIDWPPRSS